MTQPMLEVDDLNVGYAGTMILWGVNLVICPGEVVAMVGRNGMGKTTLMRALMGFLAARKGSIKYRGLDITRLTTSKRAQAGIGYVPQGRDIFPELTVEENLRMGARVAANRAGRQLQFERVYNMFPIISKRRRQKGGTLSGGEQQMLAIGRALVGDPDILLLDEPFEGIQPSVIGELEDHIRQLKQALNLTMLIVEQDCQFIKTVADRCYVLERSRIMDVLIQDEFANSQRLEECLAL
jgi:urea ABC transporter ATP-binding protein UrtE